MFHQNVDQIPSIVLQMLLSYPVLLINGFSKYVMQDRTVSDPHVLDSLVLSCCPFSDGCTRQNYQLVILFSFFNLFTHPDSSLDEMLNLGGSF